MKPNLALICLFCLALSLSGQPFIGAGNAMEFDGTIGSEATMANGFSNFSLPVTVCAWVKPDQSNTAARLFYTHNHSAAYHGVWFHIFRGNMVLAYGDGTRRANTARRSGHTPLSPTPGEWIHVAGVIRGSRQMSLYVNGNAASVTYSGSGGAMVANSGPGQIGGYPFGSNPSYFDGQMDELSFWDRALSQTEIRDLMCRKLSGSEPNLLAYYDFDQSGTTTLQNRVMGPDATVANANQFVPSSAPVGDRSFWNYSSSGLAVGNSLAGDQVTAQARGGGKEGVHIYFVDQLPDPLPQNQQIPTGTEHYLGVFLADPTRTYNLDYQVRPSALQSGSTYQLMQRDDVFSSAWNLLTPESNPIQLVNRPAPEHLVLVGRQDSIIQDPSLDCNLTVPNVFTPNGDFSNEQFFPRFDCEWRNYRLEIYNRWGLRVFVSEEPDAGWDGRFQGQEQPEGTYFYLLQFNSQEGSIKRKGHLCLFR